MINQHTPCPEGMPESTFDSLKLYVLHGLPCGDFLTAVLSNDLMEAVARADDRNMRGLRRLCQFVYCDVPPACWGSAEQVDAWIECRGLKGAVA